MAAKAFHERARVGGEAERGQQPGGGRLTGDLFPGSVLGAQFLARVEDAPELRRRASEVAESESALDRRRRCPVRAKTGAGNRRLRRSPHVCTRDGVAAFAKRYRSSVIVKRRR